MIKKHYYSWTDIERMCVSIVNQMYKDNWRPDYIVGLTRGGNVPATIISNMTGIRCEALKVSLRDDELGPESNCWMSDDAFGIVPSELIPVNKCRWDPSIRKNILIVDDINDIISSNINWNFNFNGINTNINDEFLFITTNDNNIIMYDINENFKDFKFIYLDFNEDYGDITNIIKRENTDDFYFSSDNGVFKFDFTNFNVLDTTTGIYNISVGVSTATPVDFKYYNDLFDYNGNELIAISIFIDAFVYVRYFAVNALFVFSCNVLDVVIVVGIGWTAQRWLAVFCRQSEGLVYR